MTINCNVTGNERKRLAQTLGEILLIEPIYMKAPTFAYVLSDYTIDKNGAISFPESAMPVKVAEIIAKLTDAGFTPVLSEEEAPAEIPAETPDVAPEAETGDIPQDEAAEATEGDEAPDVAASKDTFAALPDSVADDIPFHGKSEDDMLSVSIPRAKLTDDALSRLKIMVANKAELFKRALMTDDLPIEITDEKISFPWFKLTGISGEAEAYSQFIISKIYPEPGICINQFCIIKFKRGRYYAAFRVINQGAVCPPIIRLLSIIYGNRYISPWCNYLKLRFSLIVTVHKSSVCIYVRPVQCEFVSSDRVRVKALSLNCSGKNNSYGPHVGTDTFNFSIKTDIVF